MADLSKLTELVAFCEQHGILRAKLGDLEVEFEPRVKVPSAEELKKISDALVGGFPSDDEVLFHSAPQFVREKQ